MNTFIARPRRVASIALAFLLVATFLLPACRVRDNLPDDAYKTMTIKNRIAAFSFEYRAYYRYIGGPYVEDSASHRFTNVFVTALEKRRPLVNPEPGGKGQVVQMSYVPASIGVSVGDASKHPGRPAAARVDSALSLEGKWPNFKVLERSTVFVSGVHAERIAYQVDSIFAPWPLEYHTEVSFDFEGLYWDINAIAADADIAAAVRADFDHVLQTLKILE